MQVTKLLKTQNQLKMQKAVIFMKCGGYQQVNSAGFTRVQCISGGMWPRSGFSVWERFPGAPRAGFGKRPDESPSDQTKPR